MSTAEPQRETLFGHPAGLYTLFFAEMWERFSYYGNRALLVLYMTKGFLGYEDKAAFTVYGAYGALVYMTPFFGGMLADKLLGRRRAVVIGGVLMALGQLMLTAKYTWAFFGGLALLIAGNGFFKPNISTIVGSLYPQHSTKRDGGFTIFYMGINLGAAIAPLLCGYIGERMGWEYGFGLATVGMLTGLAVFVMPGVLARLLILVGAAAAAFGLCWYHSSNPVVIAINVFVAISVLAAAVVSWVAIGRGGLPDSAGAPPAGNPLDRRLAGPITAKHAVYFGTLLAIPVLALFVSNFAPLREDGKALVLVDRSTIDQLENSEGAFGRAMAKVVEEVSKPAGLVILLSGLAAAAYLIREALRLDRVPRERLFVVFILFFFIMLFFAFFEQAGSSINLFTDRNVDRVIETGQTRTIAQSDVGKTITLEPTQAQLGYTNGESVFTMGVLNQLRKEAAEKKLAESADDRVSKANADEVHVELAWHVAADNVGMRIVDGNDEIPASAFQSVNPIYIIVLGLVFTALWAFLGARGLEPSTPFKFALGLLHLGLGFLCLWYGARHADSRGIVHIGWLLLGYLFHTMGELCLSPVGLAMVTKLSPRHLVSTVMGAWFLATSFSLYLSAIIAQFTSVKGAEGTAAFPAPKDTVHNYGDVFGHVGTAAIVSSVICFALVPLLNRWMHEEADA